MAPPSDLPADDAGTLPTHEAVRRTLVAVAGVGVALTAGALLWGGGRAGLSAALGAVTAVANLWVLARVVMALLGQGQATTGGWAVVGLLKLGALFGGMWALFSAGLAEALPFAVGYGALPVGITVGSMFLGGPPVKAPPASQNDTAGPPSPGAGQA